MKKTKIGKLSGEDLYYCQLESKEEMAEHKPPHGMYFFWQTGSGEKIYSPAVIIQRVQADVVNGKFDVAALSSPKAMQKHYKKLVETQQNTTVDAFKKLKSHYKKMPNMPKETLKYIDDMIEQFSGEIPFPNIDGTFQPSRAFAEKWYGEDMLRQIYTPDQMDMIFGNQLPGL